MVAVKRLITIKEYDCLTMDELLANSSDRFHLLDKESFELLEQMVLACNTGNENEAVEFFSLSAMKSSGKILKAKNYVGIIHLKNGQQIEILPKVYGSVMSDPKTLLLKMLQSMKNFRNKSFQSTTLSATNMSIFEIFIRLYIEEVQFLIKRGLKSAYDLKEENLNFYKGKLLVKEHILHNVVHKERFYLQFDEFNVNRAENRLIKTTLQYLMKQSNSTENIQDIRKLLAHFELVDQSINIDKDFSKVQVDRNSKEYVLLIHWSDIFLRQKSFTTFAGQNFGKALLFPMEQLFESYVAKHLKRVLPNAWAISVQDKGHYLFEGQFALRPDIVLKNEMESRIIIIDTKWKILNNQPRSNYGISQGDMYQMYAYSKKYKHAQPNYACEVWLLYPKTDEFAEGHVISYESNDEVKVNVHFVDCERIEESLKGLIQYI